MTLADQVAQIGHAFVTGLRQILSEKLVGVYIYGAAAFPDAVPTGDLDFQVILERELTPAERIALENLHQVLASEFPPLGAEMDGYYLLLADARALPPPRSQMWSAACDESWALHRAQILAGRCLVLFGPEPCTIYPPASWPELERALYGELDFVARHLHKYPDYCVLNLCRLIYSFETGEVVISKYQASQWAFQTLPLWRRLIVLARKSYARRASPADLKYLRTKVGNLFDYAQKRIETAQQQRLSKQQSIKNQL